MVSIYSILKGINLFSLVLSLMCFFLNGGNTYINDRTIFLNIIMVIINHYILIDSKKNKNALLAVLAFVMILHFSFRVYTLNSTGFSLPFLRSHILCQEVNEALLFIIISEIVLWVMLHFNKTKHNNSVNDRRISIRTTDNILKLLIVSYALSIATSLGIPVIRDIVSIMSSFFFNLQYMILLSSCYFIYYKRSITNKQKRIYIYTLIAYVCVYTLLGSRSTIYTLSIMLFIITFALDYDKVRKKYLVIAVSIVPIAVFTFLVASMLRFSGKTNLSFSDISSVASIQISDNIAEVLEPVYDRVGFLDYAVAIIHDEDELRQYVTPINYFKSIVDNLLTPGFNIWDMPRMTYIPSKLKTLNGSISYKDIDLKDDYMSSEFTLFGEAYLLFGEIGSFVFLAILALLCKYYYQKVTKTGCIQNRWKMTILLYSFYVILRSYGFDWFIIEVVGLSINYWIFNKIVNNSERKYVF